MSKILKALKAAMLEARERNGLDAFIQAERGYHERVAYEDRRANLVLAAMSAIDYTDSPKYDADRVVDLAEAVMARLDESDEETKQRRGSRAWPRGKE